MNHIKHYLSFILLTPILFLLAEWVSVFPHEYGHSIVAWLYGFKDHPFAIYYGHFNWQNILFVTGIDENVNYRHIVQLGQLATVGWIAMGGLGITVIMYLLALWLLSLQKIKQHPYVFYFLCWVNVVNLAELLSYFILRSFGTHGDVATIVFSWHISPWWFFLVGGALLIVGVWHFFSHILIELYQRMHLVALAPKVFVLMLFAFILFGQGGIRMFLSSFGTLATTLGIIFCILPFLMIVLYWPRRYQS